MSGYKLNIDPRPPKEDKIAAHRDFGKVMGKYKRTVNPLYNNPIYRHRKVFFGLLLVLVIAWIVSEYGDEHELQIKQEQQDSIQRADSLNKLLHSEQ
jgi:hypothetical protein